MEESEICTEKLSDSHNVDMLINMEVNYANACWCCSFILFVTSIGILFACMYTWPVVPHMQYWYGVYVYVIGWTHYRYSVSVLQMYELHVWYSTYTILILSFIILSFYNWFLIQPVFGMVREIWVILVLKGIRE